MVGGMTPQERYFAAVADLEVLERAASRWPNSMAAMNRVIAGRKEVHAAYEAIVLAPRPVGIGRSMRYMEPRPRRVPRYGGMD